MHLRICPIKVTVNSAPYFHVNRTSHPVRSRTPDNLHSRLISYWLNHPLHLFVFVFAAKTRVKQLQLALCAARWPRTLFAALRADAPWREISGRISNLVALSKPWLGTPGLIASYLSIRGCQMAKWIHWTKYQVFWEATLYRLCKKKSCAKLIIVYSHWQPCYLALMWWCWGVQGLFPFAREVAYFPPSLSSATRQTQFYLFIFLWLSGHFWLFSWLDCHFPSCDFSSVSFQVPRKWTKKPTCGRGIIFSIDWIPSLQLQATKDYAYISWRFGSWRLTVPVSVTR
jgi:hypothetical protein